MAAKFDSGLEPAPQDFPEVTPAQQGYGTHQPYPEVNYQQHPYYQQPYNAPSTTPKPEPSAAPSTYGGQTVSSPFSAHAQPVTTRDQPMSIVPRTICGCTLLVFILSCIIALLSAAVIGLAAATGIEAQRASSAVSSLAALNASATATSTSPTATAGAVLDDGCSDNAANVNKTLYTSFSLLGALKFTRYCNRDAPNPPLLSLFTANFATCMDACAAYTKYVPASFADSGSGSSAAANATCEAVSFIPAWTSKTTASAGGAPGNCYLKGGPQNESALVTPNIGVDCHAAVLAKGG